MYRDIVALIEVDRYWWFSVAFYNIHAESSDFSDATDCMSVRSHPLPVDKTMLGELIASTK